MYVNWHIQSGFVAHVTLRTLTGKVLKTYFNYFHVKHPKYTTYEVDMEDIDTEPTSTAKNVRSPKITKTATPVIIRNPKVAPLFKLPTTISNYYIVRRVFCPF